MTAYRGAYESEKRPTLDELLADLDREELRELLKGLAARDSDLVDAIRVKVALMRPPPAGSAGARATVDPQAIRRRVSGVLHSLDRMRGSEAYWQV
ncbi:MAG: hypothetical protein ISS56_21260, partial [Anaerolineae bacterium]|nr:hypothetical protein [Anaerolineae bacterium]